jgi:hypothetical protein
VGGRGFGAGFGGGVDGAFGLRSLVMASLVASTWKPGRHHPSQAVLALGKAWVFRSSRCRTFQLERRVNGKRSPWSCRGGAGFGGAGLGAGFGCAGGEGGSGSGCVDPTIA